MQSVDVIKTTPMSKTFRAQQIKGSFDFQDNEIVSKFSITLDLDFDWNVGLIIGSSGTGKTTIAKKLFGDVVCDFEYKGLSVVDDMPKDKTVSDITAVFSSVGFSSVPSWLKPYHVLSNGEKARVDLARMLLQTSETDVIAYDEFTSYLDRVVAQTCCRSVEKVIRRERKKFVGISCHSDIKDFMEPDWVIDMDSSTFTRFPRGSLCRKKINVELWRGNKPKKIWNVLGKYHYLSYEHAQTCDYLAASVDGRIAGIVSWRRFPHPKVKNIMMGHRLVVHPDFQGLGLASLLLNRAGALLEQSGDRLVLTSSSFSVKTLIERSPFWRFTRQGRTSAAGKTSTCIKKTSNDRITFSAEYFETPRPKQHTQTNL